MPAEFDLIARCFTRPRDSAAPGVRLGIGDDAALLLPSPGCELAVSIDTLVSGVHFPADTPPADIGWKALAVNLSDLAAMGATPRACFLALTLPPPAGTAPPPSLENWCREFARGFFALADEAGCTLAGGDTTSGPLSITVTVIGEVPAGVALRRSGAKAGDLVCVSGTPGEAALGLARWQAGSRDAHDSAIQRLLRPVPRLATGAALRGVASACIDISDGLLGDLAHILRASGKLGADIDIAALPRAASLASLSDDSFCDHVLAGGDDYELCCTIPSAKHGAMEAIARDTGVAITVIGRVTENTAGTPGRIRCLDARGNEYQPARHSWEHFRT